MQGWMRTDLELAPEVGPYDPARRIGEAMGRLKELGEGFVGIEGQGRTALYVQELSFGVRSKGM